MVLGLIRGIDQFSKTIGHAFAWCIVILTLGTCFEVFVRYLLNDPTSWAFDLSYLMYGAVFYMAGAYTLSRGGHVRADMFYRKWPVRTQALGGRQYRQNAQGVTFVDQEFDTYAVEYTFAGGGKV